MEIVEDPANTLITKKAWTKSRDEKAARKYKQKEDSHFNEDIRLASSELYKGVFTLEIGCPTLVIGS